MNKYNNNHQQTNNNNKQNNNTDKIEDENNVDITKNSNQNKQKIT